jgi:antirestriction protein ArdC
MTDMAGYRRQNADGPNSEEKALDLFAEMMIEKIESINEDWRKPWFTEGALQWPRNLSGREYNGMNAFMCAPVLAA